MQMKHSGNCKTKRLYLVWIQEELSVKKGSIYSVIDSLMNKEGVMNLSDIIANMLNQNLVPWTNISSKI